MSEERIDRSNFTHAVEHLSARLTLDPKPEELEDSSNLLLRLLADRDRLEAELDRKTLTETCGHYTFPSSGGSYVCALEPGHEGDHASLWNRPSILRPATWNETTISYPDLAADRDRLAERVAELEAAAEQISEQQPKTLEGEPRRRMPTKRKPTRRAQLGVTLEDYYRMLAAQGGGCAICQRPPSERRRLDVDHDHRSGKVRGLLCHRCNRALASWITDEWLRAAIVYIVRSSA